MFELAVVNEGNAMNLQTGKFTAPRPGIYFFSFTGLAAFPDSSSLLQLVISLYLNGGEIAAGMVQESHTEYWQKSPLTLQSTLNLKSGDQIWLERWDVGDADLFDNTAADFTHFTGFMLQEEIVASL